MRFLWPWALLCLLAVPVAVWWYRRELARQRARRADLAALGLVVAEDPRSRGRGRHLGPTLLLGCLVVLVLALARPEATVADPRREGTVVLAFDVSTSMAATDLRPTRMEAAKQAARDFVATQPTSVKVGVVAFGESGLVTQQPTTDQRAVRAAIDRLEPQGGTSVGRGIIAALVAVTGRPLQGEPAPTDAATPRWPDRPTPDTLDELDLGYHGNAAVVLLSDGENTAEPEPLPLAELAGSAGVRIHPVGLGSPEGTVLQVDGFSVATALDEELLRQIATTTDGTYYRAEDARALARVYDSLELGWTTRAQRMEVTAPLAALAALLLVAGVAVSLARTGRVV
jgi:Ca-activated chloride channel family protein